MKLGRIQPTADQKRRALPLSRYLRTPLPTPPVALDNTPGAKYGLYKNDIYGDCTIAALANFLATAGARRGFEASFTDDDITRFYFDMTGGVDGGLNEIVVLDRAIKSGFPLDGVHKLAAWVSIDRNDLDAIRSCVFLFDAIYIGAELPITAQHQDGPWDADGDLSGDKAPGSWGGHALIVPKYDANGPVFITWGFEKPATWAWWRTYVVEAYALLWRDVALQHGVDWDALQDDLNALRAG